MTDDDEKMSRRREEATQQRGRGRYLSSQTSVVGVCVCVGAGWAREGGLLISVNLSMFVSVIYLMRVILSPTLIRPRWFLFSKLLCLIPELKQANLAAVDSIDYTYPTESVSFLTWCRIDRWIIKWSLILFISMVFFVICLGKGEKFLELDRVSLTSLTWCQTQGLVAGLNRILSVSFCISFNSNEKLSLFKPSIK